MLFPSTFLNYIFFLHSLVAFSDVAKEFSLSKPDMVQENIISIEKGRHILQQICASEFVPNDFHSSMNTTLIKIFTGPNASGKSVYLKQVNFIIIIIILKKHCEI